MKNKYSTTIRLLIAIPMILVLLQTKGQSISDTNPDNNGVGVSLNPTLEIIFDYVPSAGSGSIYLLDGDSVLVESFDVFSDLNFVDDTVWFTPATLNPATTYSVFIPDTAITDGLSGFFGGISDLGGWNFTTLDNIAPTVTNVYPGNGSSDITLDSTLAIVFDEEVFSTGLGSIYIVDSDSSLVLELDTDTDVNFDIDSLYFLASDSLEDLTTYSVIIPDSVIEDGSGNSFNGLGSLSAWTFTTGDFTGPIVTQFYPADESVDVLPEDPISIKFNEPVFAADDGYIYIFQAADTVDSVSVLTEINFLGDSISFVSSLLSPQTRYTILIPDSVLLDDVGNNFVGISSDTLWNFNTASLITATFPVAPYYVNEEATFSYLATSLPGSADFILFADQDDNDRPSAEEVIEVSTIQDANVEFDFNWPDIGNGNLLKLAFGAYDGQNYEGTEVLIEGYELTRAGADATDQDYPIDFFRAGPRSVTTPAIDLSTSDKKVLYVHLDDNNETDSDNQLIVQISNDGGNSFITLTSTTGASTYFNFGDTTITYDINNGSSASIFRILQTNTTVLPQDSKTWSLVDLFIEIGDVYTLLDPGLTTQLFTVEYPDLTVDSVLDFSQNTITTAYPGDIVRVAASLEDIEIVRYKYISTFLNDSGEVFLESQTYSLDNLDKTVEVAGTIPTTIDYGTQTVYVYAYPVEDGSIIFGDFISNNFSDSLDGNLFSVGGTVSEGNLVFDETGERRLQTRPFAVEYIDNAYISFEIARKNNIISPANTTVYVEYSIDGGATFNRFTESYLLNDLATDVFQEVFISLPIESASSSTIVQIVQDVNNGEDLDAWLIDNFEVSGGSNIISTIEYSTAGFDVLRPVVTLSPLEISELTYPLTPLTIDYTIDEGIFPANTAANLYIEDAITGLNDIFITSIADVTTGTIDFVVPGVEAGDYVLYLEVNGEAYGSLILPVYDLSLTIENIYPEDTVSVNGTAFTYPGSDITIDYVVEGELSGAVLELAVFDANLDDGNGFDLNDDEFVIIGSTSTIDGSITATLPIGLDYDPAVVRLSISGDSTISSFKLSESVIQDSFGDVDEIPIEIFSERNGVAAYSDSSSTIEDAFTGTGERSLTSIPIDMTFGGSIDVTLDRINGSSSFMVELQGYSPTNGWFIMDSLDFGGLSTGAFSIDFPSQVWSDQFRFRLIYNETSELGTNSNVLKLTDVSVSRYRLSGGIDYAFFNLIEPSLDVEDLETNDLIIGQDFTFNFNAQGFPSGTSFAAVLRQGDEFMVVGETSQTDAAGVTVDMPYFISLDSVYALEVIPYTPDGPSDTYREGFGIDLNNESDYQNIEGADFPNNDFTKIKFDDLGERTVSTQSLDLVSVDSAILYFDFNLGITGFDFGANTNTIPRLQIRDTLGAFVDFPESFALDSGLLYLSGSYIIGIPEEFRHANTEFRWIQPLNLGVGNNMWTIENVSMDLISGNAFPSNLYSETNNPILNVTFNLPDLTNYLWSQSDLDVPIFNGDSIDYSWDTFLDNDFPIGTIFTFYLYEGANSVVDPETDLPLIIGTTDSLGISKGYIPSYILNNSYNVHASAFIDVAGEPYYFYGDEVGSMEQVGTLDVFLKVVRTDLVYNANDVFYAGSTATFTIDIENDETSLQVIDSLYANFLVKDFEGGDLLIATQQGVSNIVVDLPPFLRGNTYQFEVQLSEEAPLGTVGEILGESDYENIEQEKELNFLNQFDALLYLESRKFYESELGYSTIQQLEFNVSLHSANDQTLLLQYELDSGSYTTSLVISPTELASYTVDLPTDFTDEFGNNQISFRWILSEDELDGSYFSISDISFTTFQPSASDFEGFQQLAFENDLGRGLITTRDFSVEELENITLVSFDLLFDETIDNIPVDQSLVFEYSTDNGSSFTEIGVLPEQNVIGLTNYIFQVTDDMKNNGARFRFRQEERNNIPVSIINFSFLFGKPLLFDYIGDEQFISEQTSLITSLSKESICTGESVSIGYEIRGRMGSQNKVSIIYESLLTSESGMLEATYAVTEGTDVISVNLPSDIVSGVNNESFRFKLTYDDPTTEGYEYDGTGPYSEQNLEVVAPIELASSFTVDDPLACDTDDVIISLDVIQNYFNYEIIDLSDNSSLGTITYNPELTTDKINIGQVIDDVSLGMRVTSMTSDGNICNSIVSSFKRELEVLEDFKLRIFNQATSKYDLVQSGDSINICANDSGTVFIAARLLNNGSLIPTSGTQVEWFRNDLATPIDAGITLASYEGEINESGNYFARITNRNCQYTTTSIFVNVYQIPDTPEIEIVSGSVSACEGENNVVLKAPDGYTYYEWLLPVGSGEVKTNQIITADAPGLYHVRVSNQPFGAGCSSAYSSSVAIERFQRPAITLTRNNDLATGVIPENESIIACDELVVYFHENDNSNTNSGSIQIYQNGSLYGTTQDANYALTETGTYNFDWINEDLNASCTSSSVSFDLTIIPKPSQPQITLGSGNLQSCEGDLDVVIEGPAGFSYYEWMTPAGSDFEGATTQSIIADAKGQYQVRVSNTPFEGGCGSAYSEALKVDRYRLPEFDLSTTGNILNGLISAGASLQTCDEMNVYFHEDENAVPSNSGLIEVYQNTLLVATTTDSYFTLSESGNYNFVWVNEDLNASCTTTSVSFDLDVQAIPATPAITLISGSQSSCQGDADVVLEATSGFLFYEWSGPMGSMVNGASSSSVTIDITGSYSVRASNRPFNAGCGSAFSDPVIIDRYYVPSIDISTNGDLNSGRIIAGETLSTCNEQIIFFHENLNSFADNNGVVQVFFNGALYSSTTSSNVVLNESGTYGFTWVNDNLGGESCSSNSIEFDLDIISSPSVLPSLSVTGDLEFCQGEGSAILNAPSGFTNYQWFRDGSEIFDNDGIGFQSNTFEARTGGSYTVRVGNDVNCFGPMSNAVEITSYDLPDAVNYNFQQVDASCGPGPVVFNIFDGRSDYSYQLINVSTGLPSGNAVTGSDSDETLINSDPISLPTSFYIEVTTIDGTGCVNFNEYATRMGENNNVVLEMDGNEIIANISNFDDWYEIRWYRNEIELKNRRNRTSISIIDAAQYSIEVDFPNACTVSSNTVEIEPSAFVSSYSSKLNISAYPNPASEIIKVEVKSKTNGAFNIVIMNMFGQVVYDQMLDKQAEEVIYEIPINDLNRGIYKLSIIKGNKVQSSTIVKQ